MRRETFIKALSQILIDIAESNMQQTFEHAFSQIRESQKEGVIRLSFESFRDYSIRVSKYSTIEQNILKILDLDKLSDPNFWEQISRKPEPSALFEIRNSMRFAVDSVPKLISLVKQDYVDEFKNNREVVPEHIRGMELLTLILPEDDLQFSSPTRLIYALESITKLYEVFCEIDNVKSEDLIVLACDSGSDKSFDILGLSQVMSQVKETIVAIWDRRVFHRHAQMTATLTLITQSLPILLQIDSLAEGKTIEREQAELMKRKIIDGTTKFLESGAITPEMEREGAPSPRSLMRPEQRLLAAPVATAAAPQSQRGPEARPPRDQRSDDDAVGLMTVDEIARLRALLSSVDVAPQKGPRRSPASSTGRKSRSTS